MRLKRKEVPDIPRDIVWASQDGLVIDAVVGGKDCRWRLTPRGKLRLFIRYRENHRDTPGHPWEATYFSRAELAGR